MRLKIRISFEVVFDFIKNMFYFDVIGVGFIKYEIIYNGMIVIFNKKFVVLELIVDLFGEVLEFERVVFD